MRRIFTILAIGLLSFTPVRLFNATTQTLPFTQNWTTTTLITTNDDWTGVPGIMGYRGDDITSATGVDPQTLLGEGTITVDVNANRNDPNTFTTGGVTEFDGIADPVVALTGSGTADAPNIIIYLNTTGLQSINVGYNLRDIDGSIDNAVQPVALQYRVGSTGNFTNVAAGFVADASSGPSLATLVTPVSAVLPAACDNQAEVQVRIITTNAAGNDEWIGIDDISITGTPGTFNSANSNIIYNTGFVAPSNIDYTLYQAPNITDINSIEVAQFTIQDGGGIADGDALGTTLTNVIMGLTNFANVRRVAIYDGTTELAEVAGATSVSFSGLSLVAPDDGSKTFSVRVTFNTAVTDNQQFVFTITSATADPAGSTFAAGNAGGAASSSVGDNNRIEVTGDRLAYVQNTTSPTGLNVAMAPAVALSANDANANRDLDFVEQVRITSTGTLTGSPVDIAAVAGLVTFPTLTHSVLGTGLTLNAERTTTLDWDVVSNPFDIIAASSATDYFRSLVTGNWNTAATWESSPDNLVWQAATLVPDFNANTVYIRNGHTVTASTAITIDQVEIESGGILLSQMPVSTGITFNNGTGDDMFVRTGGMYQVISTDDYTVYNVVSAGGTIHIQAGGIIRIGNGLSIAGSGHNAFAITSATYIWDNGSIFDWNTLSSPGTTGVTFFPDAGAAVIPVWRFTVAPTAGFGGGTALTVNGVLEANDDVIFSGNSNKVFRNGITGSASVTQAASTGKMIINGTTAVLGGIGVINPNANGLDIGTTTNVTLSSAKTINGNIALLANSFVALGAFDLTVTGTISGGSTTSYIRTNGLGSLILNNITALRDAPIGNSTYNPLVITNSSGHNWTLRVEDVLPTVIDPIFAANADKALMRIWHITPSTIPTLTGADIIFQYDETDLTQLGPSFVPGANVQVWRLQGTDWIAASVTQIPGGVPTARVPFITNWSLYSQFAISNFDGPLPIKLISFNAIKINNGQAKLDWELAVCCSPDAQFEVERSADARNFTAFATVSGSATNRFYLYNDTRLGKGITYYRLKMTDEEGKVSYSKVVAIVNDNSGLVITNVAPNPVSDRALLTLSAGKAGTVSFEIYNLAGLVVKRWTGTVAEGTNSIPVQVDELAAGVYQVQATGQNAKAVVRFIKY